MSTLHRKLIALVAAVVVVLVGCSSLPKAGPVTAFERDMPDSESLVLKGFGPVEGADPERIVRDFLRASAAGWSDDFQVARAYLTKNANSRWRPEAQVQIYSDDQIPNMNVAADEVQVVTDVEGVVTPDGKFALQSQSAKINLEYVLVQDENEQWRIDSLPDGILISQSSFQAVFMPLSVYFLSPDMSTLVADPRWFPGRRVESYLMQALIDGPSEEIAPAVVTAVPAQARLPLQQVQVVSGKAEVQVEGENLPNPTQQAAFKWQVVSTLMQVPSVTQVMLRNNDLSLDDVVVPAGPSWSMDLRVGLNDEGLVFNGNAGQILVMAADKLGSSPSFPTTGPVDSSPFVYLSAGKVLKAVKHESPEPVTLYTSPKNLSTPSVDRLGFVWATTGDQVVAASMSLEDPIVMAAPWTSGDKLRSVAVSPDGARILLMRHGDPGSVWYTAVKRSADGTPVGLNTPERLEVSSGKILDATWVGNTSVAVLQAFGSARSVTVANLSGRPETLTAPADAKRISGGATPQAIFLDNQSGTIYQRSGASWRNLSTDVQFLTYPR